MDFPKPFKSIIIALLLIGIVQTVKTDLSDDACGIYHEEEAPWKEKTSPHQPLRPIKPSKDNFGRPRPGQRSLLIIFDGTGSMTTDLAQLRSGAREIVKKLATSKDNPIYNYILSVFRDPEVEEPLVTTSSSELLTALDKIVVQGGGDCPEKSLHGIMSALEHALPNSVAYVFSDASATDYNLYDSVKALLQKKAVKVSFLLTGVCLDLSGPVSKDGREAPGFKVYQKLGRASGGQVFDMKRDSVEKVLLTISEELDSKYESLMSVDSDVAGKTQVTLKVDESLKSISLTLEGTNSKLSCKNDRNEDIKSESLITLDNIKVIRFNVTDASYFIEASAESAYSLKAGGISELKLDFGFSTNVPSQKDESFVQPLTGFKNVISIFISDPNLVKCLTHVSLVPVNKPDFPDRKILLKRYKKDLFASAPFDIPPKMFKIIISGYDKKGNEFERSIVTGIESVDGSKPEVEIEYSNLRVDQHQTLYMNCKVVSKIPAVTIWMFEKQIIDTEHSNQSTSFVLEVSKFDVKNVGKYSCEATNSLGKETKEVSISIKMAPTVEVKPSAIELLDGEASTLTCKVGNTEGEYEMYWINEFGKKVFKNESTYSFTATKHHHKQTVFCVVRNGEFEVSNNCSISVHYSPDFRRGTDGAKISKKVLHGSAFKLNCESDEHKEAKAKWSFMPKDSESDETVDFDVETKVLKVFNMNSSKEGKYVCVVENLAGNASKTFTVTDLPNGPPLIESSEDVIVKEGEDIVLECSCRHCLPMIMPKTTWNYDNKLLRNHKISNYVDEAKDFFKTTIMIKKVVEEDAGYFECLLFNKNKTLPSSRKIELVTHIKPRDITITGIRGKQTVIVKPILVMTEPTDFTLKCIATAYPVPVISWFKNGIKVGDREVVLAKKDISNHSGNYTCQVSNIIGMFSQSVQVKVKMAPFSSGEKKRDVVTEKGEKVVLSCDIQGSPEPRLSWMHGDQPLVVSSETKLSKDKRTVELIVNAENIGEYSCLGINELGKEIVAFYVFIKGPPSIVNPENEAVKIQSSDIFFLTCEATGYPIPKVEWIKDKKVIQQDGSLKIEQSGIYECKAENSAGTARKTFNVSIVELPFVKPIDDVQVNPKSKANVKSVKCLASGLPAPEVYWLFDEKRIHEGASLSISLTMDSGLYKCVAENSEGKVNTTFNVEILSEPEVLDDFDDSQANQVVAEGSSLNLICPLKNYEEFIWEKDEELRGDFYNQTFELINIDLQFKGRYKCTAFNEVGSSSFTYTLDVLTKPTIEVLDHETNKTLLKNSHHEEHSLIIGTELKMPCKSHGNPLPNVAWSKSSVVIGNGDSYDIESISPKDGGTYMCTAENSQSKATRSFKIDVYERPYIKDGTNEVNIEKAINEPVTLECNILGYPKPNITWHKDDVELPDERNENLVIQKLSTVAYFGAYKCIGDNGYGSKSVEFFVTLEETAKVLKAEEVKLSDKNFVSISCVAKGRPLPVPDITMSNGNSILSSSRAKLAQRFVRLPNSTIYLRENGEEESLFDLGMLGKSRDNFFSQMMSLEKDTLKLDVTLKKTHYDRLGLLKCTAKNDKGSDEKEIKRKYIHFGARNGSKVIYDTEWSQPLELQCNIAGFPKPMITWKFNNQKVNGLGSNYQRIDNGKTLMIKKVLGVHGGNSIFKCTGTNSVDTLIRTFQIRVNMKPKWTEFSEWKKCSVPCGEGVQKRERTCELIDGSIALKSTECSGKEAESRRCNSGPCDGWSKWSPFSACSRTCGIGYKLKTRDCITSLSPDGENWCEGSNEYYEHCSISAVC